MSVSARSARHPAESANLSPFVVTPDIDLTGVNIGAVDLRRGGAALGGGHLYEGDRLVTGWHSHDLHQIEYAVSGVVEVETAAGHYLLPPQQAAWIPAGLEHQSTMNTAVRTVSVMFDPSIVPHPGDRARILAVSPLIREMMIYALRWPIFRLETDDVSDGFFRTLGHLVAETLDHEEPLSLPTSADPVVAAAMAYTREHLGSVTAAQVGHAVGVSERTLRRQFAATLGMSWRTYLLQARLLRAMALLAEPGPSVLDVSLAVGFDNVSAFARAFAQRCGETPSTYRRRVTAAQPA
ncbi:helix-turn-helix transcriptional regulator [Frankia sp. CNm7]|uniref:Helix-turn-helix transcriptional regulator n=1 Tax=Frankia nepalensis TaxID=1836974 RepID=A0A937RW10_9ACTN|nr:helix-turn-helix transcriptional regulator [Frankia nepalensis]MBL7502667.1 helix-turn-helix transcriptional regulator [Frankia nepalensis]MBL7514931.1 helix-turn-helix transcriptional regulator [Frankia nepalensis]MBL7522018.1 helix-turn-helix transcriptional regulator [Frankia nepalensis]MBL7632891.1 helix-turn-helix transcriptional regulator [Frankia nepalensis]